MFCQGSTSSRSFRLLTIWIQGAWVTQLSNKTDKYTDDTVPRAHRVLDSFYKQTSGPYLLGDKVTYADFAVYMLLDNDDRAGSKIVSTPRIAQPIHLLLFR